MSKMDDMRAMREARYEATRRSGIKATAAPKVQSQAPNRPAESETDSEPLHDGLCGHRAISGRTCTREHGHEAQSHRYS